MARWNPIKRRDFISRLRKLGFEGPVSGTRHEAMLYKNHRLAIPSNEEYSIPQLRMMLRQVETIIERGIDAQEWHTLAK